MKLGNVTLYSYKYLGPSGTRLSSELNKDATKSLADDVSHMEDALALHKRLMASDPGQGKTQSRYESCNGKDYEFGEGIHIIEFI